MAKELSDSTLANIRKTIDAATADKNKIPGCVAVVVGKDGKIIFSHASGTKGVDTKEPMSLDTVFWIASCTKLIGGIAALQLCEQGKLSLDDADMVEEVCPELKSIRILTNVDEYGKAEYVDKKNRITLRMLLTHTGKEAANFPKKKVMPINCSQAGFGYCFPLRREPANQHYCLTRVC